LCTTSDNAVDGFDFASTSTGCKLMGSCAVNNTVNGIDDNTSGGGLHIFNNVSMENGTADYAGVTAPIVSRVSVTDTTGFWANIAS